MRRAALLAWWLYDWAGSAFSTIVVTFVFAAYFVRAVAITPVQGTTHWAAAQTAAGLVIAVGSAPLGAIADRGGHRRSMLAGFALVMVLCTAGLWFIRPHPDYASLALVLVASATVAAEFAFVFYNAMLPDIAPPARIGRVSGIGWGLGYAGGLVCLALCLTLLIEPKPPLFGLLSAEAQPVRATALFAAGWIALFSWPIMVLGPAQERRHGERRKLDWRALRQAGIARFLLARMLYTDGLNTLFAFGGIFAAAAFGMDARQTLLLGIVLNLAAGLGAAAFALVQDRIGDRSVVLIAVTALAVFGTSVLLVRSVQWFWVLAVALGVFVGPAQSASRSLMARLAPAGSRNTYFGLYALSGRVTGFIGPMALGAVTAATGSQRAGMGVIVVLLVAGGSLLASTRLIATSG
jgi:MFS transporter, UMF1 family